MANQIAPETKAKPVEALTFDLVRRANTFAILLPGIVAQAGTNQEKLAIALDAADRAMVEMSAPRRAEMATKLIAAAQGNSRIALPINPELIVTHSDGKQFSARSVVVTFPDGKGKRSSCTLKLGNCEVGIATNGNITAYGELVDAGIEMYKTKLPGFDLSTGSGALRVAELLETLAVRTGMLKGIGKR